VVPEPKPTTAEETETVEETNDLSALPEANGPYTLAIEDLPQFQISDQALAISKKLSLPIKILDRGGKVARVIDWRLGRPKRSGSGGAIGQRSKPGDKSGRAIELLLRPQGATYAELLAITDWPFGERWIRRLANSKKLEWEEVGAKHWRLKNPN
jgi:hypothetical protein